MVVMAARAVKVSATRTLMSKTALVTTATSRKILAGAGTLTNTVSSIEASRNSPWPTQLVSTLQPGREVDQRQGFFHQ